MSDPATPFRLSLKRTKQDFMANSTAEATATLYQSSRNRDDAREFDERDSLGPRTIKSKIYSPSQGLIANQMLKQPTRKQEPYSAKIKGDYSQAYQQLSSAIQNIGLSDSHSLGRQKTRSYIPHKAHNTFRSEDFPEPLPEIFDLFERERADSIDGRVHYQKGFLPESKLLYYAIGCKLVLVQLQTYFGLICPPSTQPKVLIFQMNAPVLALAEIVMSRITKQPIQRHSFGRYDIVLIVSQLWQVSFFSLVRIPTLNICDLGIRLPMYSAATFLFDYDRNGDIFYLEGNGQIGRMSLETQGGIWGQKSYPLSNHLFLNKVKTQRKRDRIGGNPSIFNVAYEQLQDIMYFFQKKSTKSLSLKLDHSRMKIYTLTQTALEGSASIPHREIRIYNTSARHKSPQQMGVLQRINCYLNNSQPVLERKITEQQLYQEIAQHMLTCSLKDFRIEGLQVIEGGKDDRIMSNVVLILNNGSRMYLYLDEQQTILNELVNLPNIRQSLVEPVRNASTVTPIAQMEPQSSFKLLAFSLRGPNYVVVIRQQRKIATLYMARLTASFEILQVLNCEEVEPSYSPLNIFLDLSHMRILHCGQITSSEAKYFLAQHSSNKTTSMLTERLLLPLARQVLENPSQYLLTQSCDPKVVGVAMMRPIDIVVQVLGNIPNKSHHTRLDMETLLRLTKEKYEGQLTQEDILAMLVQIYCDHEGAYIRKTYTKHNSHETSKSKSPREYIYLTYDQLGEAQAGDHSIWFKIEDLCLQCKEFSAKFEEALLFYPASLLKPIWGLDIRYITEPVLNFLMRVFHNFDCMLRVIGEASSLARDPKNGTLQMHSLIGKLIQFLSMLEKVTLNTHISSEIAYLSFSKGLSAHPSQFQECIFYELVRNHRSNIRSEGSIQQWQQLFPYYFSPKLIWSVRLVMQLPDNYSPNLPALMSELSQNQSMVTEYLAKYLFQTHYIKFEDMEMIIPRKSSNQIRKSHLWDNQFSSPLEKVIYGLQEVDNDDRSLEQKDSYLKLALQNIDLIKNLKQTQVESYRRDIHGKQKRLKIQKMLTSDLAKSAQNTYRLNRDTQTLLRNVLLTQGQLKALLVDLRAPTITLVFICMFGGTDQQKNSCFHDIIHKDGARISSQQVRRILSQQVFERCPAGFTHILPVSIIAPHLDSIALGQMGTKNVFRMLDSEAYRDLFWVGSFLHDWGWSPLSILDYYIDKLSSYRPHIEITEQKSFLYNWFSGYRLVKEEYIMGRRIFSRAFLKIYEEGEQDSGGVMSQRAQLLARLTQQLRH